MPGSNNRVFFACLGVAKCTDNTLLEGVVSGELGVSLNINSIISPVSTTTVGSYADLPDAEFSYTEYLKTFAQLSQEDGVNDLCGFNLAIGSDNSSILSATSAVGISYAALTSITYSLPVDGFFTTKRTYKGFTKTAPSAPSSFTESQANPELRRRQHFTGSLPNGISNNAIQNIDISYTLNRTSVPEFSTRRPYAVYINLPIETTITFELITQNLDSYVLDDFQQSCRNVKGPPPVENISISVCGCGSININKAHLSNIQYNGGSANSNESQTISVTYSSYDYISGIKSIIKVQDGDDPYCQ